VKSEIALAALAQKSLTTALKSSSRALMTGDQPRRKALARAAAGVFVA